MHGDPSAEAPNSVRLLVLEDQPIQRAGVVPCRGCLSKTADLLRWLGNVGSAFPNFTKTTPCAVCPLCMSDMGLVTVKIATGLGTATGEG